MPAETPRAAITRAALSLFAEQGYLGTTMSDIGRRVGLRGPSLYRHVQSKQELLVECILLPMERVLRDQAIARASSRDVPTQLRRMVEIHVRFHAQHREEAFVGNNFMRDLEEPAYSRVVGLRSRYEQEICSTIVEGRELGLFSVRSPRVMSYAIIDMGIGISRWYRSDGALSVDELAFHYADLALTMLTAYAPGPSASAILPVKA